MKYTVLCRQVYSKGGENNPNIILLTAYTRLHLMF